MNDIHALPDIHVIVPSHTLSLFTTLLQSGIEISATSGETLGKFLDQFPGFTPEYLAETVQTIFLDGTAVDDLTLPLEGDNPVLALSAAMPGLAGAIFRKNSFHSALRTETKSESSTSEPEKKISVTLKLFNSIARERGAELLAQGVPVKSIILAAFLGKRPNLLKSIASISWNEKFLNQAEFNEVLEQQPKIKLKIVSQDD
ncbi:MAG: hypothetical protein ACN4GW_06885 [Desulforhopalus sp.]